MTATDELRRLLDERRVEHQDYEFSPDVKTTSWDIDTSDPRYEVCAVFEEFDSGTTLLRFWNPTPAQAITATLGSEPDDAAMVRLHDQMNAALLEYERAQGIEKRDGDGEVVVPFVAEMHRLIEEAATLGAGTCKLERASWDDGTSTWGCICSACDAHLEHETGHGFNYCPNCGRKVMDK